MSISDVQTMAGLGDSDEGDMPIALRTPLYPIIAGFGLLMLIGTLLTWGTADSPEDASANLSVSGLDAGGWGAAAIVCAVAIMALGILGYFWNPFSDPEAMFIAGFGLAAVIGAIAKLADVASLFSDGEALFEYFGDDVATSPGIGLWLVLLSGALAVASAVWILVSRPKAQAAATATYSTASTGAA